MIRDLIESVTGYSGLFVFCVMAGLLVPLPEDFPLLYAGVRIAAGEWGWTATLLVGTVGVFVRDLIAWGIGRVCGAWLLHTPWVGRIVGEAKLARAQAIVSSHGASAVLMGRFLIGFRSPVFMVAGAMGVSARAFALWDLVGLLLAVPITVGLGYAFGEPIADVVFWILQRTRLMVLCGTVAAVAVVWWRLRSRAADPPVGGDPDEAREGAGP